MKHEQTLAELVERLRVKKLRCDGPPSKASEAHLEESEKKRRMRSQEDASTLSDGDVKKCTISLDVGCGRKRNDFILERIGMASEIVLEDRSHSTRETNDTVTDGDVVVLRLKSVLRSKEEENVMDRVLTRLYVGSVESCHPVSLQRFSRSMQIGERALFRWNPSWEVEEGVGDGPAVLDVELIDAYRATRLLGNEKELKLVLKDGEGWRMPSRGCPVRVSYRATVSVPRWANTQNIHANENEKIHVQEQSTRPPLHEDGFDASSSDLDQCWLFDSTEKCIQLGTDALPPPMERLLESMRKNEEATLCVFGESAVETIEWACKEKAWDKERIADPFRKSDAMSITHSDAGPQRSSPLPLLPSSLLPIAKAAASTSGVVIAARLEDFVPVRDVTGTGEVMMYQLRPGQGEFPMDCPLEDCDLRLRFVSSTAREAGVGVRHLIEGRAAEQINQLHDVETTDVGLGVGELPKALDMAVHLLLPSEVARVECTSRFAKPEDDQELGTQCTQASTSLNTSWIVELVSFEKPVNWYHADFSELMMDARRSRERGNALFKKGKHHLAKIRYEKTLGKLNGLRGMSEEEASMVSVQKVLCHLNLSACFLRLQEFGAAIEHSTKALELDPSCVKGRFRLGQALGMLNEYERARKEYLTALDLDPSCKSEVESALQSLESQERAAHATSCKDFSFSFPTT